MNIYKVKTIQKPIKASLSVPGSKSFTNRALLIAALAKGTSTIRNALISDDTTYMYQALQKIGVNINLEGNTFEVEGTDGFRELELRAQNSELSEDIKTTIELYLGNAGTAVRFLTAAMSLAPFNSIITGNERMQERPINDLVDALKQLGAKIEYLDLRAQNSELSNSKFKIKNLKFSSYIPILIQGNSLQGGTCKIPGTHSSQYFSALMIAGIYSPSPITIEVIGDLVSKPYIDMTIDIIENFGGKVINENYKKFIISNEQNFCAQNYEIEADAGSASYFFGIAAATESDISVSNAKYDSLQGEIKFVDVLEKMGCICSPMIRGARGVGAGGIFVHGPRNLKPLGQINLNHMPDTAMTVAVLCCLAKGKSILRGLENLRIKETDRLKALATELTKVGAKVKELDDGLEIDGDPENLHGAEIETYDDHRMAMCFAVLGTRIPGIVIKNPDCVKKTYPDFWSDLEKL